MCSNKKNTSISAIAERKAGRIDADKNGYWKKHYDLTYTTRHSASRKGSYTQNLGYYIWCPDVEACRCYCYCYFLITVYCYCHFMFEYLLSLSPLVVPLLKPYYYCHSVFGLLAQQQPLLSSLLSYLARRKRG